MRFGNLWKLDRLLPGQTNSTIINTVLTEAQLPQPTALVRLDNGKVRTLCSKAEVQITAEKADIRESMETGTRQLSWPVRVNYLGR